MTRTRDAEAAALRPLVELVDGFRPRQQTDGSVVAPTSADVVALEHIRDLTLDAYARRDGTAQAAAFAADVEAWLAAGLDSAPDFARSRDALLPPENGGTALFVGPVQTTNSLPPVRRALEVFHAYRREPQALEQLGDVFPHPKNNCQSMVLMAASEGFRLGKCIVFFPENVAAPAKPDGQAFAMFTFSKFRKIHEREAVPVARALLRPDTVPTASTGLEPDVCFEARACWGYLHDYFHYRPPWPIDAHLALKMNWFVGVLEELAVDCRTVLACADGEVPYAAAQIDMILLERVFRYPQTPDATRNFDSATGVLLYSWLRERDALRGNGPLVLDRQLTIEAIREFVAVTQALENEATDEADYKTRAKKLVREYLPEGAEGDRYAFTADQTRLLGYQERLLAQPPLAFSAGEW